MNPAPNLVLVGPMGAGKSSLGRRLGVKLGLDFVDADRLIEEHAGAEIPLIFELEGEAGFRAREESLLAELLEGGGRVIATGGGAVLSPATRARCSRRATAGRHWRRWPSCAIRCTPRSPTSCSPPTI